MLLTFYMHVGVFAREKKKAKEVTRPEILRIFQKMEWYGAEE